MPALRQKTSLPLVFGCLVSVVGLLLLGSMAGCSSGDGTPEGPRVYVGTGSGDPEEGIYTFRFDSTNGELTQTQDVTPLLNPTYLALAPNGRHLYSVGEASDSPTVHAFDVDPSTGDLTPINAVAAKGGGPCYISLDASGRWVLTANYGGGNVAVFPVRDDGGLGPAVQVVQHSGSGANPDRQASPHAHYFHVGPQNQYALAVDLGIDQVRVYPFDAERGRLDTTDVHVVSTPPGTGPRHLAFHPNGQYVYLVGEISGTVTAYEYDGGQMTTLQTVSTVPEDFEGAASSAAIRVHPSGDFLYASNRGDANGIVSYSIDEATGRLEVTGRQRTPIRWPRDFAIDPSGKYLLVANRRADTITIYRVDPDTGTLTYTGRSVEVPSPTNIVFAGSAGE